MSRETPDWERIINILRKVSAGAETPSVSSFAYRNSTPFQILISTVISLRTRDQVTIEASERLFKQAGNPDAVTALTEEEIAELIYPAGFYKTKAVNIKKISEILIDEYGGNVPREIDELLKLPGVGRKTANLTIGLSFGIPAICVDTHVHRIPNRMGWIKSASPEKTEEALAKILPEKYWIEINELLVAFGQTLCTPVSPKCSDCPFREECPRIDVDRSR